MNQSLYLFEVVYVSYVLNVPLGTINLSASYEDYGNMSVRVRYSYEQNLVSTVPYGTSRYIASDAIADTSQGFSTRSYCFFKIAS